MAWTLDLLKKLNEHEVRYVLVGGLAGIVHGLARQTQDIDICAPLDEQNVSRILAAYGDIHPRFRMRPDRPPLPEDPSKLRGLKNLNLLTDLGTIDFLSELPGVGDFEFVARHSINLEVQGLPCRILDLDTLISAKQAAGRRKDLYDVAELEIIRKRLRGGSAE